MEKDALIGRTVDGKYEIEALVGQGAMGAVYRARQTSLGTKLALKVLHRANAAEPMFAARFLREAQAASRVDHPSSMRVVDFGEEPDGLLYIAMEYVDGRTLAEILSSEGALPVSRIVDIASQALAALAVAHDIGVVHRDLKPENIMVLAGKDDEGNPCDIVKVCDFGVAKVVDPARKCAPSVTAEGLVVGTPEYMSPEQARGEECDARSDIYSMGVLLFHLMTGKVPFDSSTAFGTALMHVTDEPTRPTLLNPSIDARLEGICLKAMKKRPSDRYATARELRAALRALVDGPAERAERAERAEEASVMWEERMRLTDQIEKTKPRSGMVVAAVVAVAAIAGGTALIQRGGEPTSARAGLVGNATLQAGSMPAKANAKTDAKDDGDAKARAEADAKARADADAKAEADAKAAADAKAEADKAEAERRRAMRMPTRVAGVKGKKAHAGEPDTHGPAPADKTDPADLPLPVFPDPPPAP